MHFVCHAARCRMSKTAPINCCYWANRWLCKRAQVHTKVLCLQRERKLRATIANRPEWKQKPSTEQTRQRKWHKRHKIYIVFNTYLLRAHHAYIYATEKWIKWILLSDIQCAWHQPTRNWFTFGLLKSEILFHSIYCSELHGFELNTRLMHTREKLKLGRQTTRRASGIVMELYH